MFRHHSAALVRAAMGCADPSWRRELCFAAVALFAVSCARVAPRVRSPHEEPAPHLRGVADSQSDLGAAASTEATPDPATEDVTLGGILAYADQHSPVLLVARSTRSRAKAERIAASPLLPANPEVTVAVGSRRAPDGTSVDVDAALMQQLQIAGERGLRREAANRARELTDAEIEQIRWTVHCDVHAAFHRALVERERARLAERVVAFQEEVLRVVERQISAGETAALSLRLAQAEVAQARQILIGAQQTLLGSRLQLAQLAGWPVRRPPNPSGDVDAPRDPPAASRLLAVAQRRLPRLRADGARVREAEARIAVADREAWPEPSVGVQYRREGSAPGQDATHIVMGVLSMPIPSFQVNQGDRARAHADVIVAEAELTAARTLLEGQIAEAHSKMLAAAQMARAYGTEILPRFEENLTLLQRSFELGEIDILALSTGRERFLRILSDALGSQIDYFVALAGLERVVGVDLWRDHHHEEEVP